MAFRYLGPARPCWLDFPMNVQAAMVEEDELVHFVPEPAPSGATLTGPALRAEVERALKALGAADRPLLWLGIGVRMAGTVDEVRQLVEQLGVPVLVTWSAADLLPSSHPLCAGRAGTYGQRSANLILQNCDYLLTIGTRLAIPQVGYEISELARGAAQITVVDLDPTELAKYPQRVTQPVCADAGEFIRRHCWLAGSKRSGRRRRGWLVATGSGNATRGSVRSTRTRGAS